MYYLLLVHYVSWLTNFVYGQFSSCKDTHPALAVKVVMKTLFQILMIDILDHAKNCLSRDVHISGRKHETYPVVKFTYCSRMNKVLLKRITYQNTPDKGSSTQLNLNNVVPNARK